MSLERELQRRGTSGGLRDVQVDSFGCWRVTLRSTAATGADRRTNRVETRWKLFRDTIRRLIKMELIID